MTKICLLFIILLSITLHPVVYAADINVDADCSLADAITAANKDESTGECPAGDGADVITLSADITLEAALPQITTEITIEGGGFTVSGDNHYRIFIVNGGTLTVNELTMTKGFGDWGGVIANLQGMLTISNSTMKDNSASEGGAVGNKGNIVISNSDISYNSAGKGGAIHNASGKLTITDSIINRNESDKGEGGAIYIEGGTLTITNSSISSNSADHDGGAIHNGKGKLTINNVIISSNSARFSGGAIHSDYGGTLRIIDSIISSNSANWSGGAIRSGTRLTIVNSSFLDNSSGQEGGAIGNLGALTVTNTTFIGNSASEGGGIRNYNGKVNIANSTFNNNSAEHTGGGIHTSWPLTITNSTLTGNSAIEGGGGIYKNINGTLILRNSIISNNHGGDCFGRLEENIGSLIADGSCFAELTGDPMLGDLVEPEDGSPAYYPLLPGSPAIDAASDEYCADTDQIGTARPQGAGCDIGAIEFVEIDG